MNASEFSTVRSALGLSQSGMAAALGVDQGTISRWESGKVRIPAAIELALATSSPTRSPRKVSNCSAPLAMSK